MQSLDTWSLKSFTATVVDRGSYRVERHGKEEWLGELVS